MFWLLHNERGSYDSQEDVNLVMENALTYNSLESSYGRAAAKLRITVQPVLRALDVLDDRGSTTYNLHQALLGLLDARTIKEMCRIDYPIPPKPPAPVPADVQTPGTETINQQIRTIETALATAARAEAAEAAVLDISEAQLHAATASIGAGVGSIPAIRISSDEKEKAQAATAIKEASRKRKRTGRSLDTAPGFRAPSSTRNIEDREDTVFSDSELSTLSAVLDGIDDSHEVLRPSYKTGASGNNKSPEFEHRSKSPDRLDKTMPNKPTPAQLKSQKRQAELQKKREEGARYRAAKREKKLREQQDREEVETAAAAAAAQRQAKVEQEQEATRAQLKIAAEAAATKTAATAQARQRGQSASATSSDGRNISEWGLEVDRNDVSNHDSFLLFNSGWVLPEGTRRRRNASSEQPPGLPNIKRGEHRINFLVKLCLVDRTSTIQLRTNRSMSRSRQSLFTFLCRKTICLCRKKGLSPLPQHPFYRRHRF